MTVYIDDMAAPFGRMLMNHMIATTTKELIEMVDKIGVQRKWIQRPGTAYEHFDISKTKKRLAIENGAVPISWLRLSCMIHYRLKFDVLPTPGKAERWQRREIKKRRNNSNSKKG